MVKGKEKNFTTINKQARTWFFTINAHADSNGLPTISADSVSEAFRDIDPACDFVFQLEKGDGGYVHYQCSLLLSRTKPRRRQDVLRALKKHGIPDAHAEIIRRIDAATQYCSKKSTREAGPFWSSPAFEETCKAKAKANGSGSRGDRALLADAVDDGLDPDSIILDDRFRLFMTPSNAAFVERYWGAKQAEKWSKTTRQVQVTYIWGDTGVGKTSSVRSQVPPERLYAANLDTRDPFGSYRYQPALLLDEFRGGGVTISYLLELLQGFPLQLDRRYHNCWAAWTDIYICSNWSPEELYRSFQGATQRDIAALRRRITKTIHMTKKGEDYDIFD